LLKALLGKERWGKGEKNPLQGPSSSSGAYQRKGTNERGIRGEGSFFEKRGGMEKRVDLLKDFHRDVRKEFLLEVLT